MDNSEISNGLSAFTTLNLSISLALFLVSLLIPSSSMLPLPWLCSISFTFCSALTKKLSLKEVVLLSLRILSSRRGIRVSLLPARTCTRHCIQDIWRNVWQFPWREICLQHHYHHQHNKTAGSNGGNHSKKSGILTRPIARVLSNCLKQRESFVAPFLYSSHSLAYSIMIIPLCLTLSISFALRILSIFIRNATFFARPIISHYV